MPSTKEILESLGEDINRLPVAPEPVAAQPMVRELGAESQQIQSLAKVDANFLAALLMPTVFKYFLPPVFLSVYQWLLKYANET